MQHHGGLLIESARALNIPVSQWLDLSTGVSPFAYPVSEIPAKYWHRLPEEGDGLEEAALSFYNAKALLAVAGEQQAIQAIPLLRKAPAKVAIVSPTYNEHAHNWKKCGHQVIEITPKELILASIDVDVVVVVNPNNPTGMSFTRDRLLYAWKNLKRRNGWLIVDEAFMDTTPELSLADETSERGLIILRSFGKFFGLPGLRLGFVLAWQDFIDDLKEICGPWSVSGPARYIGKLALSDRKWHLQAKDFLIKQSAQMNTLLTEHNFEIGGSTDFFVWVKGPDCKNIHELLKAQAILTRYFEKDDTMRFGLHQNEVELTSLSKVLSNLL